ncbi:helix-turn-helix transcriptional regulator [Flavobacterium hydatis]|uniref:AraC family transcriptional regulator n=1 Tax=Flavobacterium hydatis TaxID=991 RepID=A0A085ZCA6_FLAHY|nr:AraC family transcriptional regulator [Flavobacterium hydatis]KFF02070.1 hypothetical protein IW20_25465 [Flavobacterium hydatis]OXA92423.1 AraC family transcriptional regulator [Flavobacterium hydatis]
MDEIIKRVFSIKTFEHFYSADLDWVAHFAKQLGAKIEGNFIVIPENSHYSGTCYFLECEKGIVAFYINGVYNVDFHIIQKNVKDDFVALYYNLTEGEASLLKDNKVYGLGLWKYNLLIMDGTLQSDFYVKAGSEIYILCVFIKKTIIKIFAQRNKISFESIKKRLNLGDSKIAKFDRMSNESYHILNDLRKLKVGGPVFDLNLKGSVQLLLSNYQNKLSKKRIILEEVNKNDFDAIISSQMFLIDNLESSFPTIKSLAFRANMCVSKFKVLFKEITGTTPNIFFMSNKLHRAKELLEGRQLTILQISDRLHFGNTSYFGSKFKKFFGISPSTFIKQL